MTITPNSPASQEMNTAKAIDTLLADISAQLVMLSARIANLEANEGPSIVQTIVTLYDNTLSGNGSWDVQNSDLISGVGNFADYDFLELFILNARSTAAVNNDVIYLLYGSGGALDTTVGNYGRESLNGLDATPSSGRADDPFIAEIGGSTQLANVFSSFIATIFTPGNTTMYKNAHSIAGNRRAAASHVIRAISHTWENTGAITRIGIRTDNDPTDLILAGSRLVILGHLF